MFDDGSRPNGEIRIERVCAGNARLEAHADSKGRFSFQLGQNTLLDTDASDSLSGTGLGQQTDRFSTNPMSNNRGQSDSLWNCELRAAYPGYRSDVVELGTRRSLDDPDVGTIILHRLVNVKGSTISLTTAQAPKPAQKDYEKGLQLAQKGKFDEAEKRFLQATEAYPKFAAAWFALGQIQQRGNKPGDARKSYQAAIDADGKYVSPYDQLALLAAQDGKWDDAARYSKQAIDLNPVEFPSAFWYNAISNYNLKKADDAEKSAQALVKLDTRHRYPEAESMLAQIALEKGDYPDAATHLRSYLQLAPNAKNADTLKAQLLKIEEASAATKK
jgi:tetratricopeptide (TPR) repeat protein